MAAGIGAGKPVSMALQGGGAHGAFTWGVLDKILEDGRLSVRAITATSAGAMNAAAAAAGALDGGADGARERMDALWRAVSRAGALYNTARVGGPWAAILEGFGVKNGGGHAVLDAMVRMTSPYDRNPFNFHPLREILDDLVDFDRLRAESPARLFIAATNIGSGRARVFETHEMTVEALLASACLPFLFHAVEIDGDHYWDGGYVANPALLTLFESNTPKDVIIVHLNPLTRQSLPTSPDGIINRVNEITFNAALLAELRAIDFAQRQLRGRWFTGLFRPSLRRVRVHSVRADEPLADLPAASKYDTDWAFLTDLRDRGRDAATLWLETTHRSIGRRSSIDIHKAFLDPRGPYDGH